MTDGLVEEESLTDSIVIEHYKSFRADEPARIRELTPVNVLVGKNNSGKSSLLECIEYLCNPETFAQQRPAAPPPQIRYAIVITQNMIDAAVPTTVSGGPISGNHHEYCSREYVGKHVEIALNGNATQYVEHGLAFPGDYTQGLATSAALPLRNSIPKSIGAERDVRPEQEGVGFAVQSNGQGLTNAFRAVLNDASLDQSLIEVTLLKALNEVMAGDGQFERIQVKQSGAFWEIHLKEMNKPLVRLGDMGSGMKTILFLLFRIWVEPVLETSTIDRYVFTFEELENNVHPGLQRRLLTHVRDFALNYACKVFLATHSSVVLDLFAVDPQAQILHVSNRDGKAIVSPLTARLQHHELLEDLGTRASDILQSNGLIWVEGPSDRIYLNAMLATLTDGRIREGAHYGTIFYGGKVISHFSADDVDDGLIDVMSINRNAICVIDRDDLPMRPAKVRLKEELERAGELVHITRLKEIECDLPIDLLAASFAELKGTVPEETEGFLDYLSRVGASSARAKYKRSKVAFARLVCQYLSADQLTSHPVWSALLPTIVDRIDEWNKGS